MAGAGRRDPKAPETDGSGEFFGELGAAGYRPRSAHVVAVEGLTCLVLSAAVSAPFAGRGEEHG